MGNRVLTDNFSEALEDGLLRPLLERVKNDRTLLFCIRDGFISVYYRGGSIINLAENKNKNNQYTATFAGEYATEYLQLYPKPLPSHFSEHTIVTKDDVCSLIETIQLKKEVMDFYLVNVKENTEKEFQQLVARDNNCSPISNDTDYFIADIELVIGKARFDMLAFRWPSTSPDRKKDEVQIALVEMKYGSEAIAGKQGISKHFTDMETFLRNEDNFKELAQNVEQQINQLNKLGLLDYTRTKNRNFTVDRSHFEIIFILANHKPSHSSLLEELEQIQSKCKRTENDKLQLRFFTANSAGYGMYDACMMDIDKYIELIKERAR